MAEISREQAINLAIVIAKWHCEWMRLRMDALSMNEIDCADFLWKKFPTIQGTANVIAFEKLAALRCDESAVGDAIRALIKSEKRPQ